MKLFIPKDIFDNPHPPRTFLCTTSGKRMGELPTYESSLTAKWNAYSELSFSIDKTYVDVLTGETKTHPLFDKTEGLRQVLVENMGYFIVQDPDTTLGEKDNKALSCFSSEYATGSKYLESFRINTGEIDSKEVIYEASYYGDNATKDDMYKLASADKYDYKEQYYHRVYKDARHYDYEQIQITDETVYKTHFGNDIHPEDVLYIHGYANVKFYDPNTPELSLLHLIFEKIPEWKIGHVDFSLRNQERKFNEDRIAVYDFLMNNVTDTFKCVVEWDTLTRTVNFYEEADDGITEDNTVQSRFETDVYISKDNLASELNIKYSTDNIKTRLKVSGADTLDIREVNLGQNYIMNLDYYHNTDWMEQDLVEAYDDYLEAVEKYSPQYSAAMQSWVEANNKYNDLMNSVPVEGNVVLVGDEFKKLYCIYGLYNSVKKFTENTTYYVMNEDGSMSEANPQPDANNFNEKIYYIKGDYSSKESELIEKLTLYHVNEDIDGNKQDNILLRLKNSANDVATIRVYNASSETTEQAKKEKPLYKIQILIVRASTGVSESASIRELSDWINGDLRVDNTNSDGMALLKGFKINYIGTMGAYFVLAKDEREAETLEEYGVNLLKEKHDIYVTIFQTQTEAMFSQQKYQCIVQHEQPEGDYDDGTRWLDTNSSPVVLKEYDKDTKKWDAIEATVSETDREGYENYQRYIDNYEKMVAVQNMLVKKQKEAEYWLNGYKIDRVINYTEGDGDGAFYAAADAYFRTSSDKPSDVIITRGSFTTNLITVYTFTTVKAKGTFAIYLQGNIPYISYVDSQGIYQARMNAISKLVELSNFFSEEQWIALSPLIREDEYTDDNFLLTSYESEEERLEISKELMKQANKELKTLSQPSLEFSMTMANILALPEFTPLVRQDLPQFALGNFIRIELRPNIIKRSRLLECTINFDDLSDFSCTFGNLVTTKSEIDLHADLLAQAVQAGKTVATAAGTWQAGADKANQLEEAISSGLSDAALSVGSSSGQNILWDQRGILGRKLVDGTTDTYEPEQFMLTNNKLVFTNDGFKTAKTVFGSYTINGETRWGSLAEYLTADTIEGKFISGGSIEIGTGDTKFVVNEDGSVEIKSGGQDKYASSSAMQVIDDAYRYRVDLTYSDSTIFSDVDDSCTITCTIYDNRNKKDVTQDFISKGAKFSWIRSSYDGASDATWNAKYANQLTNEIIITAKDDVTKNAQFSCDIIIDETKLQS